MEKISYEKLGNYIVGEIEKHRGTNNLKSWYDDNTKSWEEELRIAESNSFYNEEDDTYYGHVEVSEVGSIPLLIDIAFKYNDEVGIEYYI